MGLVVSNHAILFSWIGNFRCLQGQDADQLIPECVIHDLSQDLQGGKQKIWKAVSFFHKLYERPPL